MLRETTLTSVGPRSYQRRIVIAILCGPSTTGIIIYPFYVKMQETSLLPVGRRSPRRHIIYPFHIILRSTSLTSVGRRSPRRHIAVTIFIWAWYRYDFHMGLVSLRFPYGLGIPPPLHFGNSWTSSPLGTRFL